MCNVHLFPVELTLIMQLKAQEETDHVLLNMTFTVSNIIE